VLCLRGGSTIACSAASSTVTSLRQVTLPNDAALPVLSDVDARKREIRLGNRPVEVVPAAAVGGNFFFCLACGVPCLCKFEILTLVMLRKKF
jgi:hypothetical protein